MTFRIALFLLPFFLFGARIARSQLSLATCKGEDYVWLYNSKSQSPCVMSAYLMEICQGSNYTIYPLLPDYVYLGPWKGYEEPCSCGTVTWSLFAACGTCQNEASISWSQWSYNCSSVHASRFPYDIPQETVIPGWAYLPVGGNDMWNVTAAKLGLGGPESTATSPPSPTLSGPPKTPDNPNGGSKDNSPNMIGPIVGGVVGGAAVLAILVVGIIVARRRYVAARRPPSLLHGPQGTTPYRTMPAPYSPTSPGYDTEPSMGQKLYDPSDPTTYPSSLSYEPSATAHTNMPDSPVYGQQTYQMHGAPLSPNRYASVQ